MSNEIINALIGGFFTVLASLTTFYLTRYYLQKDKNKLDEDFKKYQIYPLKSRDCEADVRFLMVLPALKKAIYKNCHLNWDTGITLDMTIGNNDLIWFLQWVWLGIARFYPEGHFGKKDNLTYIDTYIVERFLYHSAKLNTSDPVESGSISRVLLGMAVAEDLDRLILDLLEHMYFLDEELKDNIVSNWIKASK